MHPPSLPPCHSADKICGCVSRTVWIGTTLGHPLGPAHDSRKGLGSLKPGAPIHQVHFMHPCSVVGGGVRSKCTALLNRKHGRFGRIQALASAHALRLTTYYHMPEYFG